MPDLVKTDDKKAAPNLAFILKTEGIRQSELSRDCGIRQETINRLIKGKQKVSEVTQYKILKSLIDMTGNPNYTLDFIFE